MTDKIVNGAARLSQPTTASSRYEESVTLLTKLLCILPALYHESEQLDTSLAALLDAKLRLHDPRCPRSNDATIPASLKQALTDYCTTRNLPPALMPNLQGERPAVLCHPLDGRCC